MLNRLLLIYAITLCSTSVAGQSTFFEFNFDDCTGEDVESRVPGITFINDPTCECGIGKNSYEISGNDHLLLSPIINNFFVNDYSFDFYFTKEDVPGSEKYLISHRSDCNKVDSLISLRYSGATDEYNFELAGNINNYFSTRFKVDNSKCWHRFTLVKFKLVYTLYIDSKKVASFLANETIHFSKVKPIIFGHNSCSNDITTNFSGRLDDIRLFRGALSENQILSSDVYMDRIKSPDITVFKDSSTILSLGQSCADIIAWTPVASLDVSNAILVVATPEQTTTYIVNTQMGNCITMDSVTVYVTSKDQLDCEKLLLPTAFTPNDDGLNDTYYISNPFIMDAMESFEIYGRNGAKLWQTNSMNEEWDGTMNGEPQSSGMYMYRINYTCKGKNLFKADNFVLLR
jgi:gliding motility-associated-like protein